MENKEISVLVIGIWSDDELFTISRRGSFDGFITQSEKNAIVSFIMDAADMDFPPTEVLVIRDDDVFLQIYDIDPIDFSDENDDEELADDEFSEDDGFSFDDDDDEN